MRDDTKSSPRRAPQSLPDYLTDTTLEQDFLACFGYALRRLAEGADYSEFVAAALGIDPRCLIDPTHREMFIAMRELFSEVDTFSWALLKSHLLLVKAPMVPLIKVICDDWGGTPDQLPLLRSELERLEGERQEYQRAIDVVEGRAPREKGYAIER